MSAFKPEQRRLFVRGRSFHFVTYDAQAADPRHGRLGSPAMWYMMVEGHRCPVFPWDPALSPADLDAALHSWLADNALGPVEPPPPVAAHTARHKQAPRRDKWWGPN